MNDPIKALIQELSAVIEAAYTEGVTLEEAEKLAGRFLHAQIQFGEAIKKTDLDARMRKNGLKAVKAAVYLAEVQKADKKPSDVFISAVVDKDSMVASEQTGFDQAEVNRNELENMLNVAHEGHLYFRGIAKGRFE